jgi:hypothetical protein
MFKLFASCDPKYLNVHAPALVASAAVAGNNLHLHVIGAGGEEVDFLHHLTDKWFEMTSASFSFSVGEPFINLSGGEKGLKNWPDAQRTMFACDRFVTIVEYMERNQEDDYLIIDTDCLIMKHIEKPDDDQIGLFLREPLPQTQGWENQGTRVAAGVVYYSSEALPFARQVMRRIKNGPYNWFLDQVALNEIYQSMISNYRFHYFDEKFMDWEFIEGTTIWTGKGPRKYDNPTYLTKKNEFDRMIR